MELCIVKQRLLISSKLWGPHSNIPSLKLSLMSSSWAFTYSLDVWDWKVNFN